MISFQRLSTIPTLPDLIRADADVRAAAVCRVLPVAVWCRPSTLLVLRGHNYCALVSPPGSLLPVPLRRAGRTMAIRVCFLAAGSVLTAARLLLRAGFLAPNDIALALRWSSGLARTGMRLWRRGRLCKRL
jgi:hypothetical protein